MAWITLSYYLLFLLLRLYLLDPVLILWGLLQWGLFILIVRGSLPELWFPWFYLWFCLYLCHLALSIAHYNININIYEIVITLFLVPLHAWIVARHLTHIWAIPRLELHLLIPHGSPVLLAEWRLKLLKLLVSITIDVAAANEVDDIGNLTAALCPGMVVLVQLRLRYLVATGILLLFRLLISLFLLIIIKYLIQLLTECLRCIQRAIITCCIHQISPSPKPIHIDMRHLHIIASSIIRTLYQWRDSTIIVVVNRLLTGKVG